MIAVTRAAAAEPTTCTPEQTAAVAPVIRYHTAEIEVLYVQGKGFSFRAIRLDGIDVDPNGDIHVPWLQDGEGASLTFRLSDQSDAMALDGIRIFFPDVSLLRGPVARPARAGDPYPGTFFEVTKSFVDGRLEEISLTETRAGAALIQPFWYQYEVSVIDAHGKTRRHDPRIYNKGDNGSDSSAE